MTATRRSVLAGCWGAMLWALLERTSGAQAGSVDGGASDATQARVISIVARRFRYEPNHIVLIRGQAVTLQFHALDFMHGFSVPDWGIRADLQPGQITEVHVQPDKVGWFTFLCDNFCGEGHEGMFGEFVVEESPS